ncbi:hypothetical protein J2847_002215 [Azospirillum agricola]|nr:hypothetical protein [Azospirillum agricola]SMH61909.1 hypothetical protein SAMN02982994_6031 [Azospirillum lipoferum]
MTGLVPVIHAETSGLPVDARAKHGHDAFGEAGPAYFPTSGHSLSFSGRKAWSAGTVASTL